LLGVTVSAPDVKPPELTRLKLRIELELPTGELTETEVGIWKATLAAVTTLATTVVVATTPPVALHTTPSLFEPAVADLKVKPKVQAAPAASVAGQTLVTSAVTSAPLVEQDSPLTAAMAVTVTAPEEEAPTRTVPRSTLSVTLSTPGVSPVPVRVTETPEVTVRMPLAGPTAVGVKLKLIVQVPGAAARVPQVVLEIANGLVADGLSEVAAPLLVTVITVGVVLDAPLTTLPKSADAGLTVTLTAVVPPPSTPPVTPVSFLELSSLPPQLTTVSMPMSPRQLSWGSLPNFLEHVM
jgi:hypothetical protein